MEYLMGIGILLLIIMIWTLRKTKIVNFSQFVKNNTSSRNINIFDVDNIPIIQGILGVILGVFIMVSFFTKPDLIKVEILSKTEYIYIRESETIIKYNTILKDETGVLYEETFKKQTLDKTQGDIYIDRMSTPLKYLIISISVLVLIIITLFFYRDDL